MNTNFIKLNNYGAWGVCLIASVVYICTLEPTTSLWDCGEFIAASYKLQVGHPPGAPFFLLLGRLFSLFAPTPQEVALSINLLSALASSFTILFLFWTISLLARKILTEINLNGSEKFQNSIVLIASATGSLAYTFSDTFWFSAVEGEVYAFSSLFTAVVFWAILKWESVADENYSNRWLILIAYLMGLSIGVHLLNLLAIPAIVMVYYFKKFKKSRKGFWMALGISVLILAFVMYGIIQGSISLALWFELKAVNTFALPYHSGIIIFVVLILITIISLLIVSLRRKLAFLNIAVWSVCMLLVGYSSYAMIVIRSQANPPMDENNPENIFHLQSYLNREQYGDRPLLYGNYFNAPYIGKEPGKNYYAAKNNRYEIIYTETKYLYDKRFKTLFPRMYSGSRDHQRAYQNWIHLSGKKIWVENEGIKTQVLRPSFLNNLEFFFGYQIGHMYFRYFLWNFAGKQNDFQSFGSYFKGNWITGFNFIDNIRLGTRDQLPPSLNSSKAQNKYFLLPLILGVLGIFAHWKWHKEGFYITSLLFLFTGIAIVIFLNQTPYQPRERDYAFAGSFYAFAIWIGLGALYLAKELGKISKLKTNQRLIFCSLICFSIPALMAFQNWDDHNRSGRYVQRTLAKLTLESCPPNAILFTVGDNDTFPLWYLQDVEGFRTDVRIVNLSLLSTDWYIKQMQQKAYKSDRLKMTLNASKYELGKREAIVLLNRKTEPEDVRKLLLQVNSEHDSVKIGEGKDPMFFFPTSNFYLQIDTLNNKFQSLFGQLNKDSIITRIEWYCNDSYIDKSHLAALDIIANCINDRPLCFAVNSSPENFMYFDEYFRLQGFVYQLIPVKSVKNSYEPGTIESDLLYKKVIEEFDWFGFEKNYLVDEHISRQISYLEVRKLFIRLAENLVKENKFEKAVKTIDKMMLLLPAEHYPYEEDMIRAIEVYYHSGDIGKANKFMSEFWESLNKEVSYFAYLNFDEAGSVEDNIRIDLDTMLKSLQMMEKYKQKELFEYWVPLYNAHIKQFKRYFKEEEKEK